MVKIYWPRYTQVKSGLLPEQAYIDLGNTAGASPKISFRGSEGEIQIPGRNNGCSKFSFSLQNIQDTDGPQKGSFEFIKQCGTRALESLGPMVAKLFIQANNDSYEKTRKSMEHAKMKNQMTCVKEVKTDGGNPFVRSRPSYNKKSTLVVPPSKKDVTAELPSNKFGGHSPNSRLNGTNKSAIPPPPPPSRVNGKHNNPDLIRRPLRERIIQLLAVKSYPRLEIMNKLTSDGIRDKDRRLMLSVLRSVSNVKENNTHHLIKHLWNEVQDNWPFYTEHERETVRSFKSMYASTQNNESSRSPNIGRPISPSIKRDVDDTFNPTIKREVEDNNFNPTAKRPRNSQFSSSRPKKANNNIIKDEAKVKLEGSPIRNGLGLLNGHSSPAHKPISSPLSRSRSPSNYNQVNGKHHNNIGTNNNNHHHHSDSHSPINGITNGLTNGHRKHHNGRVNSLSNPASPSPAHNGSNNTPTASPHGHIASPGNPSQTSPNDYSARLTADADCGATEFFKDYPSIETTEQRSRYKADFNKDYQEYLTLHTFIEDAKRPFSALEERLRNANGTREYQTIREQILKKYKATKEDEEYVGKTKRYDFLHKKLTHIKKLVKDYDDKHQHS